MEFIRIIQLLGRLGTALAITWGIAYLDADESSFLQIQSSLHMARQIADQAQSLSLYAREQQEKNPLGWAAKFLNSGMKDRPIKISPVNLNGFLGNQNGTERYRLNEKGTSFIYYRKLFEETGEGIQVDIQMEYIGFLGAHSIEVNDLLFAALFGFTYVAITWGKKWRRRSTELSLSRSSARTKGDENEIATFKSVRQEYLEKLIGNWVMEARSGLIQVGLNIKAMTQEAKSLVTMASKSKRHIEEILMQAQKNQSRENPALMNQTVFEVQAALQSYDEVSHVTHRMNDHISRTTDSVIVLAQLIQRLKDQNDEKEIRAKISG